MGQGNLLESKQKLNQLKELYNQPPYAAITLNQLYHFIQEEKEELITEALETIKKEGLKVAPPSGTTSFIDQKVDRPQGIYFWGAKIKNKNYVSVAINDLNKNKLFAFPHQIADEILKLKENHLPNHFWQELNKFAKAIPFTQYQGEFKAEFIYTADIPVEILHFPNK